MAGKGGPEQINAMQSEVPQALRRWFLIHFVVDVIFAVPLMITPVLFLSSLGWQVVDPVASRLVAAALFGIGLKSLLSYKAPVEAYQEMLNLKIIWSLAAITGLILSLLQGSQDRPLTLWLLLLIFIFFNALWLYWKIKISRL